MGTGNSVCVITRMRENKVAEARVYEKSVRRAGRPASDSPEARPSSQEVPGQGKIRREKSEKGSCGH